MNAAVSATCSEQVLSIMAANEVDSTLRVCDEGHGVVRVSVQWEAVEADFIDSNVSEIPPVVISTLVGQNKNPTSTEIDDKS